MTIRLTAINQKILPGSAKRKPAERHSISSHATRQACYRTFFFILVDCLGSVCFTFFARFSLCFENLFEYRGSDAWTNIAPILSTDLLFGNDEYGAIIDVVDCFMSPHSWTKMGQSAVTAIAFVPRPTYESALASAST
jgi:hypothetical protein